MVGLNLETLMVSGKQMTYRITLSTTERWEVEQRSVQDI